jgi:hypothetical protein
MVTIGEEKEQGVSDKRDNQLIGRKGKQSFAIRKVTNEPKTKKNCKDGKGYHRYQSALLHIPANIANAVAPYKTFQRR